MQLTVESNRLFAAADCLLAAIDQDKRGGRSLVPMYVGRPHADGSTPIGAFTPFELVEAMSMLVAMDLTQTDACHG